MNIQEREEMEYQAGLQTAHQNAFALSRMEHNERESQRRKRTEELLAKGFCVVVLRSPAYCFATDAIVGESEYFVSASKSYEVAHKRAEKINADDRLDDDTYAVVLQPCN